MCSDDRIFLKRLAFGRVELIATIVCLLILLSVGFMLLTGRQRADRFRAVDRSRIAGIHQAWVIASHHSDVIYPTPSR